MSLIQVKCTDQVLKIIDAPVVASGGKNEVKVEFDFCEKWEGFAKTAVFYRDEENIYYAILDSDDTCIVPWEVCYEDGAFRFSVFGEKGDVRRTSTEVRYKVKKGAIAVDMKPSDPTPDVYDQIMEAVARIEKAQAVDPTLTEAGHAADAKATGDAIKAIADALSENACLCVTIDPETGLASHSAAEIGDAGFAYLLRNGSLYKLANVSASYVTFERSNVAEDDLGSDTWYVYNDKTVKYEYADGSKYINLLIERHASEQPRFIPVTKEEYDALVEAGTVNENDLYLIREG